MDAQRKTGREKQGQKNSNRGGTNRALAHMSQHEAHLANESAYFKLQLAEPKFRDRLAGAAQMRDQGFDIAVILRQHGLCLVALRQRKPNAGNRNVDQ